MQSHHQKIILTASLLLATTAACSAQTSKPVTAPAPEDTGIIVYSMIDEKNAMVGNFDEETNTYYRWKSVNLPADKVPNQKGLTFRVELLKITPKIRVIDFDPPISYLKLTETEATPGYADQTGWTFFTWGAKPILIKDLPPATKVHNGILDKWSIIQIPKPTRKDLPEQK